MHLSATLVLATALTAAAHPSAGSHHAHLHRAVARSAKFIRYDQPAATSSAPEPSSSGDSSSSSSGEKKEFCSGSKKRATTFDIAYTGNTGSADDWGCNIMEIDCGTADLYDYTTEFSSTGDEYSCSAFNKIGPEGRIDGFWHSALDFSVKGDKVCLAFDEDSQGGVACGAGADGPGKTESGQLAGTWFEFDLGSEKNGGQSGADVSTIVADKSELQEVRDGIISMAIEAPGKGVCSKLSLKNPSETSDVYREGDEDKDGVGCKGYKKGMVKVTLGD
ncbi:hypothetical protein VUR80DRAFT_3802 [Thermomyces stellatus]